MYTRILNPLMITLTALAALASVAGCGSEPADVAGDYSVAITNGQNGCNFNEWVEGESTANIPLVITQDGTQVSAEVQGIIGGLLGLWLGTNIFTGEVDGNSLQLTLYGTTSATAGNCTYTINSTMLAESDGDVLTGQLRYEAATNGNPDCGEIEGCVTLQSFNGVRPPQ